jgi:hypothetical protein
MEAITLKSWIYKVCQRSSVNLFLVEICCLCAVNRNTWSWSLVVTGSHPFFPYCWHFCYTIHSTWNRYLYFNPADSKSVVTVFPSYWDSSPHPVRSHQSQFGGRGVKELMIIYCIESKRRTFLCKIKVHIWSFVIICWTWQ